MTDLCPSPESLAVYVYQGPDAAPEVGPHVDECPRCRREVLELFDRLSRDEPRPQGPGDLDDGLWERLAAAHSEPLPGRVLHLKLTPRPAFATAAGSPLPLRAASGLRGAAATIGAELELGEQTTALFTLREGALHVRMSRGERALAGCAVRISNASDGELLQVFVTDSRGRGKLPLASVAGAEQLEIRVLF